MIPAEENLKLLLADLEKAGDVLLYSVEKCQKISMSEDLSYEELESYEALTSRFARLSDIIIQKVFRTLRKRIRIVFLLFLNSRILFENIYPHRSKYFEEYRSLFTLKKHLTGLAGYTG